MISLYLLFELFIDFIIAWPYSYIYIYIYVYIYIYGPSQLADLGLTVAFWLKVMISGEHQCVVCMCRPRAVRVQCGHLFACVDCIRSLVRCSICREPITASYNIQGTTSRSDSSEGGYISSGSETYVSKEPCVVAGCMREATRRFTCKSCVDIQSTTCIALCMACVQQGSNALCQLCRQPCADAGAAETRPQSSRSSNLEGLCFTIARGDLVGDSDIGDSTFVGEKGTKLSTKDESGCFASEHEHTPALASDCKANLSVGGTGNSNDAPGKSVAAFTSKCFACLENRAMKMIVRHCFQVNTILEIAPDAEDVSANRVVVALEVIRCCIEASKYHLKAVLLAPTVPIVRQRFEIAEAFGQQFGCLIPHVVIGNSEVDAWGEAEWHKMLSDCNMLIATPQLFLDALNARYLHLSSFCALVVEECQYCCGFHPFAKIFEEHYSCLQATDHLRVLGLSSCLVNKKVKVVEEQLRATKRIERLMHCQLTRTSDLQEKTQN